MADMYGETTQDDMEEIPVFLINGFLEAGKTQFLRFTMEQDYFRTEGKTLLIVCEDGEEEYPKTLLMDTHTVKVQVSEPSEMSVESLEAMNAAYAPERVIIGWNGMWPMSDLRMPKGWFLNQQITIVDTSTFDLYLKNMKPLLGPMLKYTELVICNRADGFDESTLGNYRMNLKAMAMPQAEIVFEGKNGEIRGDFSIDLPYDINADRIVVEPKDFGIFYIDVMDRPERYDGKQVEYTGEVLKPAELGPNAFVPGRMVMTCCEADIQFLGLICKYDGAKNYKNHDWVKVRGVLRAEQHPQYAGVGPVIHAAEVVRTGPIREVAGF